MGLEHRVRGMASEVRERGEEPVPAHLQGVTKDRVREVLGAIDRATPDMVDAVFALLDDVHASWFRNSPPGAMFTDGATIAHIACHVGILQRNATKLDREGRDYWVKPLRELGAIEPIYLDSKARSFVPGHPVAKSPNSAYRLAEEFVAILRSPSESWRSLLRAWSDAEAIRHRAAVQARLAEESRQRLDTGHAALIRKSVEHYAPLFLPGYDVLYVDASDGDRVSDEERARLAAAGIEITLRDPMPDVLLWNRDSEALWVIEAVTSDGEVDHHKVQQVEAFRERCGKSSVGFTTAYPDWKTAARRQAAHKNIAPGTYVWIAEDPSKHFLAETFTGPG